MGREGRMIIEDVMMDVRNHNGDMIREITPTCAKTVYDEEQTKFMLNGLRSLREQYENALRLKKKVGEKRSK
jgi:hypothetical protein